MFLARTRRARVGRRATLAASATAALLAGMLGAPTTAAAARTAPPPAPAAPGAPGTLSHFGLARKDCVGTARNTQSKVWFTLAGGVLSDVYYPTVDTTDVETLQLVVTDGSSFTDLQSRDMTYTVQRLDASGMTCRVTSTAKNGRYSIVTDYVTDPWRSSVVMRTRLRPSAGTQALKLFVRFDPTVNGNGGGGVGNGGPDDAVVDRSHRTLIPVASDVTTATNAANRTYAQPVFAALSADRPFKAVSNGYAGTVSDGLRTLDATHGLDSRFETALHGNVVQTAEISTGRNGEATLALGFGHSQPNAVATSYRSAHQSFPTTYERYVSGWRDYDRRLNEPPVAGIPGSSRESLPAAYYLDANVLKASEDKTFPGAVVASLASPWGQAVSAGDPANTYFGSYREVFARDLYETFTGLLASGDVATAKATVRFLFDRQQQADGSFPRNSLLNGMAAPDSFGVQLDEVAYPILMARTVNLTDATFYRTHLKRAADFLVAHGPAVGSERWEEQAGYSPSTIAAEIAGLVAAGAVADLNDDRADARVYRAAADSYQRQIKSWTVTTNGPLSTEPYFLRLTKDGDPDAGTTYNAGNGGPDADQRAVIDQGFLELTRLGILPVDDPDVLRSLVVVDSVLRRTTNTGDGFYRYGTGAPGTEDGYGDCNVADSTDCTVQGKPWAGDCGSQAQNKGSGHLWPALSGERGESELARGNVSTAAALWAAMAGSASGIGLIPEQTWEDADLAPSPWGTAPECASIGFVNGKPAGSASPLTWSAAQFVRLAHDLREGRLTDTPADTVRRYLDHTQTVVPVVVTSPAENALSTGSTTVTGTTAPKATVDVTATNVDIAGASTTATTTADATGAFSVTVTIPAGTTRITVAATGVDGSTGLAQRTVVYDVVPGALLLDVADPDGDDNGPGTYAYPTSADFHPGAYDLQRFQVYDSGADAVTFRVQTRDLSQTFGSALGAQLVDVYAYAPGGGPTSTAASYPGRNYAIEPSSAWNRLIEVQGFGQRFVDAAGTTVGSVQIRANEVTRYLTFTVSKAALGGTPGAGWSFVVVLTGQDGFSSDQARGFTQPAQGYQFGLCTDAAVAAANPICAIDPAAAPKAMDVLTPMGVSQAAELDPTSPPVTIAGVHLA